MTKPTGRPRGRPKTKEYVTLMARVPQDLADRVQRYAGLKRQTISDVLRDGLLVLLQEDDEPYGRFMSYRNAASDIMSDAKEEGEEELPDVQPVIVSDVKGALPDNVSDMNTEIEPAADTAEEQSDILSDTKEGQPAIMSGTKKARQRKRVKLVNSSGKNAAKDTVSGKKKDKPAIMSDTKKVSARKKQAKRPPRQAGR